MEKSLITIDNAFVNQYKGLYEIQKGIISQLVDYPFDLSNSEISDAIFNRMEAFWYFNVNNNKELLGREINTTVADYFTETCLLFFKLYFEKKYNLQVKSEANINKAKKGTKVIRPDISIWRDELPVAVIELKVSDGWKGKLMTDHLIEREKQIHSYYPDVFFGVLAYWDFFGASNDIGSKHFSLRKYDHINNHPRTSTRVEDLFMQIEKSIKLTP